MLQIKLLYCQVEYALEFTYVWDILYIHNEDSLFLEERLRSLWSSHFLRAVTLNYDTEWQARKS